MAIRGIDGARGTRVVESIETNKQSVKPKTVSRKENNLSPVGSDKLLPDFRTDLRKFQITQAFKPEVQPPENKVNELKEGEQVPIAISDKDTQTDVLKKAYAEYAKRAGLSNSDAYINSMVKDGDSILHEKTGEAFKPEEFEVQRTTGSINMVPGKGDVAAARQAKLQELLSYSLFDWSVTPDEQKQVIDILKSDPNISETVKGLSDKGFLETLISRVDDTGSRRELIDVLGKSLNAETSKLVEPQIEKLDVSSGVFGSSVNKDLWQVRFNLAKLGITPSNVPFDRASFNDLINSNPSAPFSGVGATGNNPTNGSVPLEDQWGLLTGDKKTTDLYTNPVPGKLSVYLDSLSPVDRARQEQLLLNQPISTTMPGIYGDKLPSRADVIRTAAAKYNLDPRTVAALILAEQRDQSGREDAKDYTAATSVKQANTSIGLGQVVISTTEENDLFSDLINTGTKDKLSHDDRARLLADDTINIFAVAKYARTVADLAGKAPREVQSRFPGVDFGKFKETSSNWSEANTKALGSEYTSKPWEVPNPKKIPPFVDSPGWGYFVNESYKDVTASGVFK